MSKDLVLVGRIGAAHGVRGEVRLISFMLEPAAIARRGALVDQSRKRSFEIAALRLIKANVFVAQIKGISTRTAAETLANTDLYLARKDLPAPGLEEFYYADLIGLSVETLSGAAIGRVAAVVNYGGGDILQIELRDGAELLLPFTRNTVPLVDIAAGRIAIDPPTEGSDDSQGQEHLG